MTMFAIDVSSSMGETKVLDVSPGPDGNPRTREITKLEWALEFVMLKVQEMVGDISLKAGCGLIFGLRDIQWQEN